MKNFSWLKTGLLTLSLCVGGGHLVFAQSTNVTLVDPALDRWMYPNNPFPSNYTKSSEFANFSEDTDTRWAQYITGYDTFFQFPTNRGAANYLIRKVSLRLTIRNNNQFNYDPTYDSYRTYLATNDPAYLPDDDTYGSVARPIELYGTGFRNGYTPETYDQNAPYGSDLPAQRNAFAACYATNGALVDVGNNVGKTNAAFAPFEAYPFAIGQTTNVAPGDLVPAGSRFTFTLNLADPLVKQYVQESLNRGRLIITTSGLHGAVVQQSTAGIAAFWTHYATNLAQEVEDGPILDIDAAVISTNDTDADGLPDDWEQYYFHTLSYNATDDPDGDGQNNLAEYLAGTDPTSAADKLLINTATREIGGAFTVQFPCAASHHYVIEYSSDLKNWSSITNAPLTYYVAPGKVQWRDDGTQTGGLGGQRYYRIRTAL